MPSLDYVQIAHLKKSSIFRPKTGYAVHFVIIACGIHAEFSKGFISHMSNYEVGDVSGCVRGRLQQARELN